MPSTFPVVEIDNRSRPYVAAYSREVGIEQSSKSPTSIITRNNLGSISNLQNGRSNDNGSLRAQNNRLRINTSGIDVVVGSENESGTSGNVASKRQHKNTRDAEIVIPPLDEPRLKSIFDTTWSGSCIWSPSHRVARTLEAVTCQWIIKDEGFGDLEKCEKIFTTTESLAKHVHFAHCEPGKHRTISYHAAHDSPSQTCWWGDKCKFKRFANPSRLKDHVLEHLRPLAYSCPFQQCRTSTSSKIESAEDLDSHIQTYHTNEEELRPLGIPKPLKSLLVDPLPLLPSFLPQWLLNNPPIGMPREPKRRPLSPSPEPEFGEVRPWDQLWLELNKLEPPAIPIHAQSNTENGANIPTIAIARIPKAIALPLQPSKNSQDVALEVQIEAPPKGKRHFIDLTEDNVESYPPAPESKYDEVVDMTAASLAKRDAKRNHRNRLQQGLASGSTSISISPAENGQHSEEEESSDDPNSVVERLHKRLKVEE